MLSCYKLLFLTFISSISAMGQTNKVYVKYHYGGVCGTTIILNSDGTYNYETGCESISNTSFGTWVEKKDTIKFTQIDTKDFKVVNIMPSTNVNSTRLAVRILDQAGRNITDKIECQQYVQGKGTYKMELDSTEKERTDFFRDSGIIVFESLQAIHNGILGVKVDGYTNFEITVNIPNDSVYQINSKWIDTGNFELLKAKENLLSINYYPVDGNRRPVRREYKKMPK